MVFALILLLMRGLELLMLDTVRCVLYILDVGFKINQLVEQL